MVFSVSGPESHRNAEKLASLTGSTGPAKENLPRRQYRLATPRRAVRDAPLLDHLNGALRHPFHRVRSAGAAAAVGVQLNLRYAADAEPLFFHLLPRLPLNSEQVAHVFKAMAGPRV